MRMLMNFRVLFLVLLLLAAVGCKQGSVNSDPDYLQAHKYFEQGEFEKSFELMLKCAEKGNVEAQYSVGHSYLNGVGVDQDIDSALKWSLSAANEGHAGSMFNSGRIYYKYYNTCNEALYWFEKAAKAGSYRAMDILSVIYRNGQCVEVDHGKSAYYRDKAINSNAEFAKLLQAESYFWGDNGDCDYNKAIPLLNEILYEFPAEAGYLIGLSYSEGYGVDKDESNAFKNFKLSALAGNYHSQYNVGLYLYNGLGVDKDIKTALIWINKAANKNHYKALTFMGYMYETGKHFDKDIEKAKEYYRKAVELGDERAQKRLDKLK